MSEKPKPTIYFVKATIKLPSPGCWAGQTSEGAFTFVDNVVTICHLDDPTPVRDPEGKTYTRTLQAPTNTFADAEEQARLLTIDFRQALRGGRPRGFGGRGPIGGPKGPLSYPGTGWR